MQSLINAQELVLTSSSFSAVKLGRLGKSLGPSPLPCRLHSDGRRYA